MRKLLNTFILITTFGSISAFGETFKITEKALADASAKGAPQIDQIEAALLDQSVKEGEINQKYAPELFGKGSYIETNERALIEFQPVFSPIKAAQLGVRQKHGFGLDTSASITTDQRTATSPFIGKLNNVTITTLDFTMQLDIWKDVFGRLTKAERENAELERKRAEIEREVQLKTFKLSLRRLYWSLVANTESLKISEQLQQTAQKQLDETNRRFKNSVAESDEVARYKAQVASREGTILFLKYQKEILLKQLKNLLPELSQFEIELEQYNLDKTLTDVLACTASISQQKNIPYDFTRYDEAVSIMRKIRSNNQQINARYADADVKLFGTVKSTGVSSEATKPTLFRGSYQGAFDDIQDKNRTGYEVGVSFTIPLGDAKTATQRSKELYDERRLLSTINSTDAQVISTHQQLAKSITYLTDVVRSQRVNSEQLELRLKYMRRKYEQARVSVNDLVMDQDALLSSELTTIDTKLQILNTIFDYLVIFTETPCAFNRI